MKQSEGSGVDMSYNGPQVLVYRPPSRGSVSYANWLDDASCNGMDTALFELGDPDEITEDDQHDLIAQGLRVCVGCPVRAACKSDASELDRYWTTRGGQPPEGLFPGDAEPGYHLAHNGRGGGFKAGASPRVLPKTCREGHEDWKYRKDGRRFCATCKRVNDRRSEANRVRTKKS